VVGVNGLRDKWYYDSFDGKLPVESVIIKDLIPHIDKTYRTLARRQFRAVEGYSMGGFGAAHFGFKYPRLFSAVSIMAGAFLDADAMAKTADLFKSHFGDNRAYFTAGDPLVLVRENASKIRGKILVRVGVGDRDSLLERNRKYHELLDSLNIRHEYFTVPGVAHEMQRYYGLLGSGQFAFYQTAFRIGAPAVPPPGPDGAK
jgi:endo-1,4-beta-xylanase